MSTALVAKTAETDRIRQWRLQELVRAGYSPCQALLLSGRRDVDLHTAVRLLRHGCPPDTAFRILR